MIMRFETEFNALTIKVKFFKGFIPVETLVL